MQVVSSLQFFFLSWPLSFRKNSFFITYSKSRATKWNFFLWSWWTRERWIVRRNLLKRCSLFSSDGLQYPVTLIWRASKWKRHFLFSTCVWRSTFPSFSTLLFRDRGNIAVDVLLFRSWGHTSIERIAVLVSLRKKMLYLKSISRLAVVEFEDIDATFF